MLDRYASLIVPLAALVIASCHSNTSEEGSSTVDGMEAPLFRSIPADESGVSFQNRLRPTDSLNIIQYLYYYNGGGVAIGDVNGDQLPDLFFTANQGPDALYLNEGNLRFRENAEAAGISTRADWSTGASFVDVDADGDLDLYVCKASGYAGLTGHNELYVNDGNGRFEERAAAWGLDFAGLSTQAAFADFDGDGRLDCYLLNHSVHHRELPNDTSARQARDPLAGDRLLLGRGRKFVDATRESGIYSGPQGYGLGVAVADLNGDARPDLYVSNDFSENDYLYLNLGGGRFRESSADYFEHTSQFSMGSAVGDVNGDGLLDIVTLDMRPAGDSIRKSSAGNDAATTFALKQRFGYLPQYARNAVQLNTGRGFVDVAPQLGVPASDWSWTPLLFDADLDGQTDLFIANGIVRRPNDLDYLKFSGGEAVQRRASDAELAELMPTGYAKNVAYRGGDTAWVDVSQQWGFDRVGSTTGAAYADLDLDGDLDLVLNNVDDTARVLENAVAEKPSITVDLMALRPFARAAGATVLVSAREWRSARVFSAVSGFQSGALTPLVFGVPDGVDTVQLSIIWPWTPDSVDVASVAARGGKVNKSAFTRQASERSVDREPTGELVSNDAWLSAFEVEPLLPFIVLPADSIAVASAEGQWILQGPEVSWVSTGYLDLKLPGTNGERARAATWIKRETDSLLLLSFGYEANPGSWRVKSYTRSSKGFVAVELPAGFTEPNGLVTSLISFESEAAMPTLFVGVGLDQRGYGVSPTSSLWSVSPKGWRRSWSGDELGMVSSGVSLGSSLLVSAPWKPVRELRFGEADAKVILEDRTPPGLWFAISKVPTSGSRSDRFLFGNLGTNTLLRASEVEPLRLIVADFDGNSRVDPILVEGRGEEARTYFGLDELARQMPMMRKFFTSYLPFSASKFSEMFPPQAVAQASGGEATELRSAIYEPANQELTYLPAAAQRGAAARIRRLVDSGQVEVEFLDVRTHPTIGDPSRRSVRLGGHQLNLNNE